MVRFEAVINKFADQGEKTGWTYIEVPVDIAQQLKPGNRKEFKVKGKIDAYPVTRMSLFPMGGGRFILVLNGTVRKGIGKRHGAMVKVQLTVDNTPFAFNKDFMACLSDDPVAKDYFDSLPGSHQRYFSKWIDDAKTEPTRVKRITMAVMSLGRKNGFAEMIRANKKTRP